MQENEARLIAKALQNGVPPGAGIIYSVTEVKGKGNRIERYSIVGSDGSRMDYAWQWLEVQITQLRQMTMAIGGMVQQQGKPKIELAGSVPSSLYRG